MATVFKRHWLKAIPAGAEIITRGGERCAVWTDGKTKRKRRALLTPDSRRVILEAETYTIEWWDENATRRKRGTKFVDKDSAQELADKLERHAEKRRTGMIDATQERFAVEGRKSAADHLADYIATLQARQNTSKHVSMARRHIEEIIAVCKAEQISGLTGDSVLRAIDGIRQAGDKRMKEPTERTACSLKTCNGYLRNIKSFTRWLWTEHRIPTDPLAALKGFNADTDRRHVRRELTPDELNQLLRTTATHTLAEHRINGPDRAIIYRLALGTGLRASELRSLTPQSFDLDAELPTVRVAAAHSKRRREDTLPLRADLAESMRIWLKDKPHDGRLFTTLPANTARMLRSDLKAARAEWIAGATNPQERQRRQKSDFLQYRNAAGEVCDFHSTRHTFISGIVAGGCSVKVAQELARHSTPTLTIGRYSHTRLHDVAAALDSLPNFDAVKPDDQSVTLAATGTDGKQLTSTARGSKIGSSWVANGGENRETVASDGEMRSDDAPRGKSLPCAELATKKPPLASGGEQYPHGESNPGFRTENPTSWATRRWGRETNNFTGQNADCQSGNSE
jgi:integrase